MPPIPVYTSSPISAAKAAGATPQTDAPAAADGSNKLTPGQPAAPLTAAGGGGGGGEVASSRTDQPYPPARPGARPSLPAPTGAPAASPNILQPTPTQRVDDAGPPAPQPGAVPLAPGAASEQRQHHQHLPPPPKAGESLQHHNPRMSAPPVPMPAQMSYPPPQPSFASYGGSSTTTAPVPPHSAQAAAFGGPGGGARPVLLSAAPGSLSHPPGYQQDVNAAEFSSHQRAAHNASMAEDSGGAAPSVVEGTEKAWDAAKKWAAAAGESLAAAENEVWKRINKS